MKHSEINWAHLIEMGKKLVGKPYVFGSEVNLSEQDPTKITSIDCSELVEYLYANLQKVDGTRAEITMPDGSYNQSKVCRRLNFVPNDPKTDVLLLGDLGFKWEPQTQSIHHVGVFIGDGKVLEAKGKDFGVVMTDFADYEKSTHFAFWGRHQKIMDA